MVEVVYGVPDRKRLHRVEPEPGLHGGRKFLIGYLGIINEQDGVEHLVRAVDHLVKVRKFRDFRAVVVGSGPALERVRALARSLELEDFISFPGYLSGKALLAYISAFDIGVIPDPLNEANDLMSMNKVFEYCALGIPTACYPLRETKRLLGDAGVYAASPDPAGLADACLSLMQSECLRARCATAATKLAAENFLWEHEARKYVATYERVLEGGVSERHTYGRDFAVADSDVHIQRAVQPRDRLAQPLGHGRPHGVRARLIGDDVHHVIAVGQGLGCYHHCPFARVLDVMFAGSRRWPALSCR